MLCKPTTYCLVPQRIFKMSTQIDFRTLPANVPVLCIPRVYPNISESRIRRIFDDLDMGVLERVDIVSKHSDKGEKFNRVFIHFRMWNDSENARVARERLLNGKEIKIIYDDPWFWKISAYREAERRHPAPQSAAPRRATLQCDSDEDRASRPANNYREEPRRRDDSRRRDDYPRYRDDSPRRRDDSRRRDDYPRRRDDYRRRRDDYPRHNNDYRRHNDDRRRPDDKPRQDEKPRPNEARTPSCSPPKRRDDSRERQHATPEEVSELPKIDYGDTKLPPMKKRNYGGVKKPLKVEEEGEIKEEGEVKE